MKQKELLSLLDNLDEQGEETVESQRILMIDGLNLFFRNFAMMNKGGFAMWYDATFVVTFGNIMSAGTSKIKAIKDGKQVEFAKRVNIQIDKNHINGVTTRGKIVMTPHGFINDNDRELKAYKEDRKDEWKAILGGGDFRVVEEDQAYSDITSFGDEPQ